jgi:hypothetical protein
MFDEQALCCLILASKDGDSDGRAHQLGYFLPGKLTMGDRYIDFHCVI